MEPDGRSAFTLFLRKGVLSKVRDLFAGPAPRPDEPTSRRRHSLVTRLLVKQGVLSRAQVQEALRILAESPGVPLERILVDRNFVTSVVLSAVIDDYNARYRLGRVLVDMNLLTDGQLRQALGEQRRTGSRLGEIVTGLGFITERQLNEALARQFDVRVADLDAVAVDPELAALNRPRLCRAAADRADCPGGGSSHGRGGGPDRDRRGRGTGGSHGVRSRR